MYYALAAAILIGVCIAVVMALRSPKLLSELVKIVFMAILPDILKAVSPKDLSEDEKARERRGQEPGLAGQNTRNNDGMHHR
jgi:hypothetical protein